MRTTILTAFAAATLAATPALAVNFDVNDDGEVTQQELAQNMQDDKGFAERDRNDDGVLTAAELDLPEGHPAIVRLDADSSGGLTLDEFATQLFIVYDVDESETLDAEESGELANNQAYERVFGDEMGLPPKK